MEKWCGSVAVVTGASSGIGKSMTLKLAQHGMKVAALARRVDKLETLATSYKGKGEIRGYKCDISDDMAVTEVFAKIEKDMGPIMVLVNSAGFAHSLSLIDVKIEEWKNIFNTNVFGMFSCIRELMKSVKNRQSKELVQIININSVSGQYMIPMTNMMVYSCSKHCVTLLTRGLIKEIAEKKLNVRVSSLSPGVVEKEKEEIKETGLIKDYSEVPHLVVDDIANAAVAILSVPQNVIISELTIKPQGETM